MWTGDVTFGSCYIACTAGVLYSFDPCYKHCYIAGCYIAVWLVLYSQGGI